MAWTFTDDPNTFHAAVAGLLAGDPERNTVLISVLANLRRLGPLAFGSEAPVLGWWAPDSSTAKAAVMHTPPHPILVTDLPVDSAGQLATALAARGHALSAINGAESDALALAAAWARLTGQDYDIYQRQRLHRLGALARQDPPPPGVARIATAGDGDVAHAFFAAFAEETGQPIPGEQVVADRVAGGQLVLWEVAGEVMSMAGVNAAAAGGATAANGPRNQGEWAGSVARVGPVYTPPGARSRGFGGAVTAAATQLAIDRGAASVILFTDLANPVSNALYRRLGYVPVEDRVVVRLTSGGASASAAGRSAAGDAEALLRLCDNPTVAPFDVPLRW